MKVTVRKATILGTVMLAAMMSSASAQQCIFLHCARSLLLQCDPRCCDLNPSWCMRGGPIRPEPLPLRPYTPWHPVPGQHGGFGIK